MLEYPKRLDSLTIMRFFAALWVLLFHLHFRVNLTQDGLPARLMHNGAFAMSFFFVLSGVVLSYGYHDMTLEYATIRRFLLARVARIYPTYLTVHLLCLPWIGIALTTDFARWVFVNLSAILGIQAWFYHTMSYPPSGGTWSISVEFFFYSTFPAVFPLLRWIVTSRIGLARAAFYLSLLIGFYGLADYAFAGEGTFPVYYMLPFFRLPEFALGIVVGLALRTWPPPHRPLPGWLAWAWLPCCILICSVRVPGIDTRANCVVVPSLALLLYLMAYREIKQPLRSLPGGLHRTLVYLGESSYCLFLAQLVPLAFFDSPYGRFLANRFLESHSKGSIWVLVIAASLALAIALHELVEKPARRHLLARWVPQY